jgi:hypothetical protein
MGESAAAREPDSEYQSEPAINTPVVARPKLGEILVEAGLISDRAFYECLSIAQQTVQPIGHIITARNYTTEQDIDSALLLQSLVAHQKMRRDIAVHTLREASRKRIAVVEMLRHIESESADSSMDTNSFGRFLVDCNVISPRQAASVIKTSSDLNVELIRILVPMNLIDVASASKALHALARVMHGKLEYGKAVAALQLSRRSGCSLQDALVSVGVTAPAHDGHLMLGELIARSGVASEMEILSSVESALVKGQRLGETLLKSGAITPLTLQNALEIQDLLSKGVLERDNALFVLKRITSEGTSLLEFARQTGLFHDESQGARDILNLLYSARIIDEKLIVDAYAERACYGMDALKALLACGRLPIETYRVARDIHFLIQEKRLTANEGLSALSECHYHGVPLIKLMKAREAEQIASMQQRMLPEAPVEADATSVDAAGPRLLERLAKIVSKTVQLLKPFPGKRASSLARRPHGHKVAAFGTNRTSYSKQVLAALKDRE